MVGAVAARTAAGKSRPNAKRQANRPTSTGRPVEDRERRRMRTLLKRCFKVFIMLFFVPLVRAWPPSQRRFTRSGAVYVLLAERNLFRFICVALHQSTFSGDPLSTRQCHRAVKLR